MLGAIFMFQNVQAQDEEISDEELQKYAQVMNTVDQMKQEAKDKYLEMIKSDELMAGGKRFNQIKKAKGDEAKLAELEVTEEEQAAYDSLVAKNAAFAADIKAKFTEMIKGDIGAAAYNKIKKQLKTDDALKAKYEELLAALKEESSDVAETDD